MSETDVAVVAGFDTAKQFEVRIPHPDFEKGKSCVLRFPTDEEWCRRSRQHVLVRRVLGRDATKSEIPNQCGIEAELFSSIRLDKDGAPFDEYEASEAISRLDRANVVSVERVGNTYVIQLRVPGFTVAHTVKVPTQKQVMEYTESSSATIGRRRTTEIRFLLEPSGDLFDKVQVKSEGYVSSIPINHKVAVVSELLMQIQADTDDDDPEQ